MEATKPKEGAPHLLTIVEYPEGRVYGSTVGSGSAARLWRSQRRGSPANGGGQRQAQPRGR
jgi:hypothetical protein